MNKISLTNKNLIVADVSYNPLLFKFKNEHPELNIKIINRNQLVDLVSFRYKKDPLPYLITKCHESYNKAKKYMELIQVADVNKNDKLNDYFHQLKDNGYLEHDPLGEVTLSRYQNIFIFNAKEDLEIKNLLSRNGYVLQDLFFEDLDILPTEFYFNQFDQDKNSIYDFQNKLYQFMYIFSDIKRKIQDNPNIKNNINIQISDGPGDNFFLNICSKAFDLPVYINVQTPLITLRVIKDLINQIFKNKSLDFEVSDDKNIIMMNDLINKYCLRELDNFDEAYANLIEIISSYQVSTPMDDRGITATSKYNFIPDAINYVTNFQHGEFFKESDDDNVLTDKELENVGANPSYQKTLMDKDKKEAYLKYNNIVLLSRVKQHLTDSIYDSQFLETFKDYLSDGTKIEEEKRPTRKQFVKLKTYNENGLYTNVALEMLKSDMYDKAFKRKEYEKTIDKYDHSFKGIKGNVITPNKHGEWSITKLEQYILCPFKFYLNSVIPYSSDDYHARWKGTMIHYMLERVYHDDYDFEAEFIKAVEVYKEQVSKDKQVFGPKEETFIQIIYNWSKKIIPLIRGQINDGMNWVTFNNDYENNVRFTIKDFGKEYKFTGYIDKIVYTESDNKKFYTIIDYKTGSERFKPESVFLGAGTQLPMYYYAVNHNKYDLTNGYTFGGFGIKPIYFSSIRSGFVDKNDFTSIKTALNNMRFDGLTCSSPIYWKSFDKTGINQKDGTVKYNGASYVKKSFEFTEINGEEKLVKTTLDRYNFLDLMEDAISATIETIKKIENNEFDIKPTTRELTKYNAKNLVCRFCPYKDVCYHKISDGHDYRDEIHDKFYPRKEELDEDKVINKEDEFVGGEA